MRNEPVATDVYTWQRLYASWDAQQELYIRDRERRYEVLFEFLDQLVSTPTRILDLACGPGSLAKRCLERYPNVEVVAVDIDPVLLQIGKTVLKDANGRLQWIRGDLRQVTWLHHLSPNTFDVAVSSTALHWLSPSELGQLFLQVASLLKVGGVVLNADYFERSSAATQLNGALENVDKRRQHQALTNGTLNWEKWWGEARKIPELASAFAERDQIFPPGVTRSELAATYEQHRSALTSAGFGEVEMVWQDLNEGLLVALLAPPTQGTDL